MREPVVFGVEGPIGADDLGWTSAHEHVICDLRRAGYLELAPGPDVPHRVTQATVAEAHARPFSIPDNLVLDDVAMMAAELLAFAAAGGRTIVDATPSDAGRDPVRLRELARRSGIRIVMGSGHYRSPVHPPWIAGASVARIRDSILADLLVGEAGIRAGIIGEIGTQDPVDGAERRVLQAAALAQRATGRALYVHVQPSSRAAAPLLDLCEGAGADPGRVVLCHLDADLPDTRQHRELAARGAWVSYDLFGDDRDDYGEHRFPSDRLRLEAVLRALDEGWSDQLLLAQDICLKTRLRAFGGCGYDHLLRDIVPRLLEAGASRHDISALFIDNPRRVLAHPADPPSGR